MSERLPTDDRATTCRDDASSRPEPRVLAGREAELGPGVRIRRLLPRRALRMVGPWCFLDHFGPLPVDGPDGGLDIAPHPHIGLHTVTWLLEGEILHRDSLGNECRVRPGQLNLMTAGRGISHSEESPPDAAGHLHGFQLWLAQPDEERDGAPDFRHEPDLPAGNLDDGHFRLVLGHFANETSPVRVRPAATAVELRFGPSGRLVLPLDPGLEYALAPADSPFSVRGQTVPVGHILDAGLGHPSLSLTGEPDSRLLLIGGEPFGETILMWWNFVARSGEEIRQAREDWTHSDRFGTVERYPGDPLPAPPFNTGLKPR